MEESLKISIQISSSSYQGLVQPTLEYNQWSYRSGDATLTESQFSIELSDFPVFWQQFLENSPSLRRSLRSVFLDALRRVEANDVGIGFAKAMESILK